MRLKLAFSTLFTVFAAPAFAHPDHGFALPNLLHVVTNADHLAIGAGAVVLVAIIGALAFKRSGK